MLYRPCSYDPTTSSIERKDNQRSADYKTVEDEQANKEKEQFLYPFQLA